MIRLDGVKHFCYLINKPTNFNLNNTNTKIGFLGRINEQRRQRDSTLKNLFTFEETLNTKENRQFIYDIVPNKFGKIKPTISYANLI